MTYPSPEEQEREGPSRRDVDAAFDRIVAGLRAGPEEVSWSEREADDHFDPPEPPPLPILRPRTVGGLLALAAGVLLLVAPNLLGLGERVGTPLGLLALAGGIGWLLMGLRPDPPTGGSDDGARL
ncbi:MAG TPA: hypothetical protein VFO16_19200 [Pseudonocardiaceae bacterium]|nr:hypothetical protein [Pseudonocardiaceae bacterium]